MSKKKSKSSKHSLAKKSKEQKTVSFKITDLKKPVESTAPIWVDRMHMVTRDEGLVTLIFEAAIPDQKKRVEISRVVMTAPLAKSVAEVIARQVEKFKKTNGGNGGE